eukprot:gene5175-8781_t
MELYLNDELENILSFNDLKWNFSKYQFLKFDGLFSNFYIFNFIKNDRDKKEPTSFSSQYPPNPLEFYPLRSLKELDEWKPKLNESISNIKLRKKKERKYKFIHCHDMAGGYLEDRFIQNGNSFHVYNFYEWKNIDIFIYFSHYRLTIPPPSWINASHKNGVKILGTFITEWEGGISDNIKLLDEIDKYVELFIKLVEYYNFDGWFFNLESKLPDESYVKKMIEFLEKLTKKIHKRIPGSLVFWYDSVIENGEVKWQNELNKKNKIFFDSCDGIFLNYVWSPEIIKNSSILAEKDRNIDIFTGIDIWARGCLGKFETYKSLEIIKKCETSTALFAPAWTFESKGSLDRFNFECRENQFWNGIERIELLKNPNGEMNEFGNPFWGWKLEHGGSGWLIENEKGYNSDNAWVTSYQICKKSQMIDLSKFDDLLKTRPIITVIQWYCGTSPNFKDIHYLKIELRDENQIVIDSFDTNEIICSEEWKKIEYSFINYYKNVKYIYWEDGGKDIENWSGNFGSKSSGSSLFFELKTNKSVNYYSSSNILNSISSFFTSFNQGIGKKYFKNGNLLLEQNYNNLSYQDIQPTYLNNVIEGELNSIKTSISYNIGYFGSSSFEFNGNFNHRELNYSIFKLFEFELLIKNDSYFEVSIFGMNQIDCYFILIFNDESKFKTKKCEILINKWSIEKIKIPNEFNDHILKSVLFFISSSTFNTSNYFKLNLGHLRITNKIEDKKPNNISNLKYFKTFNLNSIENGIVLNNLNLSWNKDDSIEFIEIYLNKKFLSRCYGNVYCIENLEEKKEYEIDIIPFSSILIEGNSFKLEI